MRPHKFQRLEPVTAMRWDDTEEHREAFTAWFESHDVMLVTRRSSVVLFGDAASPGEWVLHDDSSRYGEEEFTVMSDEEFRRTYAPTPDDLTQDVKRGLYAIVCGDNGATSDEVGAARAWLASQGIEST